MGADLKHVQRVTHAGPPTSLELLFLTPDEVYFQSDCFFLSSDSLEIVVECVLV
ncbi:hypothetical protein DPMN_128118 [Dreissena polymorpha]|uniref:Uncharacterized protein n=1 Tax=Dreissena polymorpha TaxID=45954 RepID=A0A9D4JZE3_DREPO|nr:hypothetical protein DPMN_128118 [Dreissena polymorpha]